MSAALTLAPSIFLVDDYDNLTVLPNDVFAMKKKHTYLSGCDDREYKESEEVED